MIQIRFEAKVNTNFGQQVRIVGNHPYLGDWMPSTGFELITFEGIYPIWRSEKEIRLPEGIDLEFKIVVMNSVYQLERWESLNQNRCYTTNLSKDQVVLRMTEGCQWIEEYYDETIEKLQESNLKAYSKILAPMKIRTAHILNPKQQVFEEAKQEQNNVLKSQQNGESQQLIVQSSKQLNQISNNYDKKEQSVESKNVENGKLKENKQFNQQEQALNYEDQQIKFQEQNSPYTIEYFYKQLASKSEAVLTSTHTKVIRLKNELKQLQKCLPIQSSNSIFLVYDEQRLDIMRALIFGSEDTPYAHGAYIFDIYIPDEYPQSPPKLSIVSTKNNLIRFNPNLYADGLVCISLLGTWQGDQSENWDPVQSNIYQILISIQSLIMNEDVYFNEPYYYEMKGTENGNNCNRAYSNIVKYYNIQHSICDMIENPPAEFQQVIYAHFMLKKNVIKQTAAQWIEEAKKDEVCVYDELIEDHNQAISIRFAEKQEEYLNSLKIEVDRLNILLDSLEQRINLKSLVQS